jgi:EAL domain-containing protein (putative c-di-GMP-specific phosphodiesterase class I)
MYRAKSEGKGRFEIFDDQMRQMLLERTTLEHELVIALREQQLEIHYQPILGLADDAIVGFEALLRWNHPTRTISPDQFIPLAEESHLIHQLGDWVFQQVTAQLVAWQKQFVLPTPFRVAINISPQQFSDMRLIDRISQIMAAQDVNPSHIAIELTETAIFRDRQAVQEYLRRLKALNMLIYLDDFGTGYSSLSYLNSFPIDAIKIDRSFVSGLATDKRKKQLVNMMVLLAQELGISVIAEGVETGEVLDYLKTRTCGYAQGYFIQRPMPATEATRLLSERLSSSGQPAS